MSTLIDPIYQFAQHLVTNKYTNGFYHKRKHTLPSWCSPGGLIISVQQLTKENLQETLKIN